MPERLQKILAAAGLGSRRKCEQWISEGRVSVDGQVVTQLGTSADPASQRIELNGRAIPRAQPRHIYVALNKPRGYASTLSDPHAVHLVTELIDLPGKPMLRPVGRLDVESEGLLLLTTDGDFLYRLTHPKFEVRKTYVVTVRGAPSEQEIEALGTGVRLDDGSLARADRARLIGVFPGNDSADIELLLHEGRNRIIRRMCAVIGHPALRLVRTKVAFLTVGSIPRGGWRHLTVSEVRRLLEPVGKDAHQAQVAGAAPAPGAGRAEASPKRLRPERAAVHVKTGNRAKFSVERKHYGQ